MTFDLELSDLCSFADGRVAVSDLDLDTYVSTENMLPNKEGITRSSGLPTVSQTQAYRQGDVLVSNIRPYLRKIWIADRDGGCSNDVLVMRAKLDCNPSFLYYLLSDVSFFDYAMATAKGTKMPRGDKGAIMKYAVPELPIDTQIWIANTLSTLDEKISMNRKIVHRLEQVAQAIFKSLFVDFEPFGGVMPDSWYSCTIGDLSSEISTRLSAECNLEVLSAVKTGELVPSDDYFTKQVYSKELTRYKVVEPDDFAYNPMRIDIGSIGANERGTTCCVSPDYVVFRANKGFHLFLRFVIRSTSFLEAVSALVSGSVRQRVYYRQLKMIHTICPDRDTLAEFNQVYNVVIAKVNELKRENAILADLRDTLLPRLISGELSIADL